MRSGGSGGGGGGKLVSWLWRAPRRALCRARDFYVRSITGCAGHLPPDAAFGYGYPTFAAPTTPTMSRNSSFASSRYSAGGRRRRRHARARPRPRWQRLAAERATAAAEPATVPRSQSVAMARIDEDRPCEFAGVGLVFPRSQSCAVGARRLRWPKGEVSCRGMNHRRRSPPAILACGEA
ncbi:hypothetical protein OsJ_22940 [Oryza sativa Japonica Group]|uniref:Uncharacterized protein n=1 Tax=Oryza sativa subsp. japonica TaxID=39947 RepID=B9FVA7_ORYSJ|nr:hypothetical protein OsJ_22940 [Oryza sativa Japonica Group]